MWNIPPVKNAQNALLLFTQCQVAFGEMEANGIKIDVPYLRTCIEDTRQQIYDLEQAIYQTDVYEVWRTQYGNKASITARQQLGTVLFDNVRNRKRPNMGYICEHLAPTGLAEVSERTLTKLQGIEDFCEKYTLYMSLSKLLATNLHGIESVLDPAGFIHPSFSLFSVVSYRTSSSNPNFQNIPARDKRLRDIVRKCFIPREPDNQLIEVDYSGAEVRITAHLTQDPTLLASIHEGRDFHKEAAAFVYKLPLEAVTKILRQSVKGNLTFAAFYGSYWKQMAPALWEGISAEKLQTQDGVSIFDHLSQQGVYELGSPDNPAGGTFYGHIKGVEHWLWNSLFPVFRQWKETTYKRYLKTGYLDLGSGFRCYGDFTKNAALNMPTQGFAAHCLLRSLINAHKRLKAGNFKTKIIGQIHDSIMLDVYPGEKEEVLSIVREEMAVNTPKYYNLTVPMDIDVGECPVGKSWAEKS